MMFKKFKIYLIFSLFIISASSCSKNEQEQPAQAEPSSVTQPSKPADAAPKTQKAPTAESEKEKALANPYPSDLGPAALNVSGYPKEAQEGYALLVKRCSVCHTPSRPLNHRFAEPLGKNVEAKKAAVEKMKKENPELFQDRSIWQIEDSVWKRYVKRMMAKPGCDITQEEGKQIWEFLVYDSEKRKIGKSAASWKAHRQKLLDEFKSKHPKRYKELAESRSL